MTDGQAQQAANSPKNEDENEWKVEIKKIGHEAQVVNFIQLFQIRRTASLYLANNRHNKHGITALIPNFIDNFENGIQMELKAANILSQLIKNGFSQYMLESYYNDTEAKIVDIIFNDIVMKKLHKEYHQVIKYRANVNDSGEQKNISDEIMTENKVDPDVNCKYYFQELVFNTNDLMSKIFEHLDYDYGSKRRRKSGLFSCSLVSSHWLYQVWNLNSLYYIDLTKLITQTINDNSFSNENANRHLIRLTQTQTQRQAQTDSLKQEKKKEQSKEKDKDKDKDNDNDNDKDKDKEKDKQTIIKLNHNYNSHNYNGNIIRMWQRIIKAKSIKIDTTSSLRGKLNDSEYPNSLLLNSLSKFTNVEKISGECILSKHVLLMLKALMQACENKIINYNLEIDTYAYYSHNDFRLKSPLKLINARSITIQRKSAQTYLLWSNKCEKLMINQLHDITRQWFYHIINNCDCSGIKILYFYNVSFLFARNVLFSGNGIDGDSLLMCNKFINKFSNLEKFKVYCPSNCDEGVLILLKAFKQKENENEKVFIQNNTKIEFEVGNYSEYSNINDAIKEFNLNIHKFEVGIKTPYDYIPVNNNNNTNNNVNSQFRCIENIIRNKGLEYFKINNNDYDGKGFKSMTQYLSDIYAYSKESLSLSDREDNYPNYDDDDDDSLFETLKVIELNDAGFFGYCRMNDIIDFLKLDLICDKKLFVLANFRVNYDSDIEMLQGDDDDAKSHTITRFNDHDSVNNDDNDRGVARFLALFEEFCKIVFTLLIMEKIPIDIRVRFKGLNDVGGGADVQLKSPTEKYKEAYLSYFENTKLSKDYEQAYFKRGDVRCFVPLKELLASFVVDQNHIGDEMMVFHVSNVDKNVYI